MEQTRCEVCLQPATKKCTSCGRVFCDLHIRYGGQAGGMYGAGDVGYYCDECWASRTIVRRRLKVVVLGVGLALLVASLVGLLAMDRDMPPISTALWAGGAIVFLAVLVGITAWIRHR